MLNEVKVIDPHCHLRLEKPSADSLADVVLYHHLWVEMVSSGMSRYEVTQAGLPHEVADPGLPPLERVRRALKYLKTVRNTTLSLFLRWILADLYQFQAELDDSNLEKLFEVAQKRAADGLWQEEVLRRRCGIEASISVMPKGKPYSTRILKGREGFLEWPGYYGQRTPAEWLRAVEAGFGRELHTAQDYRDYARQSIDQQPIHDFKFIGLFAPVHFNHESVTDERITDLIKRVKAGLPVSQADIGRLAYFGMLAILDTLRSTPLRTIQLITGTEVLEPFGPLTAWQGGLCGALGRLATLYEDFHFNVSSASDAFTQDLGILAKHLPNISVAGYWWHMFYPFYIKKSLETRLDMVPANKIIGFFSDAYHCEWCYPKLKLVKQIVADILTERVERGWYTLDMCSDIITKIFYENPKKIYGV
jgi:hypothetical protein